MFGLNYLLLAAAATTAAAMPRAEPLSIALNEMINKTVCAIRVNINRDPNRIPEHIKEITCAAPTNQSCVANNIKKQFCCHNHMECVEMRDTVVVYNKTKKTTDVIEVPVGCACMIRRYSNATNAVDADST